MEINLSSNEVKAFVELLRTVRILRQRCPWDRQQTVSSTRPLLINEVYELDEAIRRADRKAIIDELGDYLFMGLFLATVLEQKNGISLADICRRATIKLQRRHPHVYGNSQVQNSEEVLANWERMKHQERQQGVLTGLPVALPALQQAQLIQERCRRVGFDWKKPTEVLAKIEEEIDELKLALTAVPVHQRGTRRNAKRKKQSDCVHEELGDLLFAIVNLCRHLDVDAEGALRDANRKFRMRFEQVEAAIRRQGHHIHQVSLPEMERAWQETKRKRIKVSPS